MTFLVIDNVKLAVPKRTPTLRQAEYWAELLCKGDYRVQHADERRQWAAYSIIELGDLHVSLTGRKPPPTDFGGLVHLVSEAARRIDLDDTPEAELARKLKRPLITPADVIAAHIASGGAASRGQGATRGDARAPRTPPPAKPAREPGAAPTRPREGTVTGKVWSIADTVAERMHESSKAQREAIIAACIADGIDASTAATQYSKWKRAMGAS